MLYVRRQNSKILILGLSLLQFLVDLKTIAEDAETGVTNSQISFALPTPQHGVAAGFTETFGALPPAVVVSGRQGPNSNINGVYIRDYTWHGQIGPCYRRGGGGVTDNHKNIFLWFEGEWRIGPSPERETVWAYARSGVPSPVLIDTPWEVWDGRKVVQDPHLWVSDTSVIPSVLFLSFDSSNFSDEGSLPELRTAEGMFLQQPGLFDGRPHYRHQTSDVFLLCSVAEGRWRLGPLPPADALLSANSAAAMPQEVEVSWQLHSKDRHDVTLGAGVLRLATTSSLSGVKAAAAGPLVLGEGAVSLTSVSFLGDTVAPATSEAESPDETVSGEQDAFSPMARASPPMAKASAAKAPAISNVGIAKGGAFPAVERDRIPHGAALAHTTHPKHIVLEGMMVWGGTANGVYRRAPEQLHQRPVYHKADSVNVASMWFTGSEWWLGPAAGGEHAWAYASSKAMSPLSIDDPWRHLDRGLEEKVRLSDASQAIPQALVVAGDRYEQLPRLCDARPVYRRQVFFAGGSDNKGIGATVRDLFLFFRAYEGEWCVGPSIGGVECFMTATGSHLRVVPDPDTLNWYPVSSTAASHHSAGQRAIHTSVKDDSQLWEPAYLVTIGIILCVFLSVFLSVALIMVFYVRRGVVRAAITTAKDSCDTKTSSIPPPCAFESRTGISETPSKLVDDAMSSISTSTRSESSTGSSSKPKRRSAVACVVCFEAPREILLEPCRHVCCCKACADKLTHCPMCRALKVSFTEVFLFREHRKSAASELAKGHA